MVDQFLKEKFEQPVQEAELQVPTNTGSDDGLTPDQKKSVINARKKGTPVKFVKKTDTAMDEKRSKGEEDVVNKQDTPESTPTTLEDLKNELSEIGSKLESMDDFKIGDKEDLKAKKLINKIKLKLDDIILVMEDLEEIRSGLEEKKNMYEEKENDQYLKQVHKLVSKRFRDKNDVEGIMKKYSATAKKHKNVDPSKVAEALFRHMLKENIESKRIDELSPELKNKAYKQAMSSHNQSGDSDPFKSSKRYKQAMNFEDHIDPVVKKAGENIAKKIADDFTSHISKKISDDKTYVTFDVFDREKKIIFSVTIDKDRVKIDKPVSSKFSGFDHVMSKFVELVRKKELVKK